MTTLKIGTRRSQLAMWQAGYVRNALLHAHAGIDVELVGLTTEGDKTLDVPLSEKGGKGLFLKELEQALLNGRVDIAVHSMKDVTVSLPDGLHIPVICERGDPHDAFVSSRYGELRELPAGAVVGTCSLRRQALLRYRFPELNVVNLRGNVNTRLQRLDDGDFDAIILAAAGLQRLEMTNRIRQSIPTGIMLPAVGQGAVGIECREDDINTGRLLQPLDHALSHARVAAERAANAHLGGGCHMPVAAFATIDDEQLQVRGMVGWPDGSEVLFAQVQGRLQQAERIGINLADDLLVQGAAAILQDTYGD